MRTAGSRRSQASRVGLLGAQGTGEAVASYATTGNAPLQWQKLNGAMVVATAKAEDEKGDKRRRHKLYKTARKQEEATKEPFPRQCKAENGHAHAWNREEGRRR